MKLLANNTILIRKASLTALSLCIYLLSLPLATIDMPIGGSVLRFIALLPIFVCAVYIMISGKVRISYIHILFILYTLLQLFSLSYSIDTKETLSRVITYLMFTVLLFATTCISYEEEDISLIKSAYLWASRIAAVFTLLFSTDIEGGRLSLDNGVFAEDPNYLCGYFIYAVVFAISVLFDKKESISRKVISVLELLVYVYIVLTTGSRGGVLGVLCGAAAYGLFYYIRRRDKLRITAVLLIFIIISMLSAKFALSLLPEQVQTRYSINSILQSRGTGRYELWKTAFVMYIDSDLFHLVFGYGAGTIRDISINGLHMKNVTHNLWLETLLEQGVVGLFLLLNIMKSCFQLAWKKRDLIASATFTGMMGLTLSLSLYAYKPLWNLIILICLFSIADSDETIMG